MHIALILLSVVTVVHGLTGGLNELQPYSCLGGYTDDVCRTLWNCGANSTTVCPAGQRCFIDAAGLSCQPATFQGCFFNGTVTAGFATSGVPIGGSCIRCPTPSSPTLTAQLTSAEVSGTDARDVWTYTGSHSNCAAGLLCTGGGQCAALLGDHHRCETSNQCASGHCQAVPTHPGTYCVGPDSYLITLPYIISFLGGGVILAVAGIVFACCYSCRRGSKNYDEYIPRQRPAIWLFLAAGTLLLSVALLIAGGWFLTHPIFFD